MNDQPRPTPSVYDTKGCRRPPGGGRRLRTPADLRLPTGNRRKGRRPRSPTGSPSGSFFEPPAGSLSGPPRSRTWPWSRASRSACADGANPRGHSRVHGFCYTAVLREQVSDLRVTRTIVSGRFDRRDAPRRRIPRCRDFPVRVDEMPVLVRRGIRRALVRSARPSAAWPVPGPPRG